MWSVNCVGLRIQQTVKRDSFTTSQGSGPCSEPLASIHASADSLSVLLSSYP